MKKRISSDSRVSSDKRRAGRAAGAGRPAEPLAARSSGRTFQNLVVGRLRVVLPESMPVSAITRAHPTAVIRLIDRVSMGDGKSWLIRFEADNIDPGVVERMLYTHPHVLEVWLAAAGSGRRSFVIRVVEAPYIPTVRRFSVLRWLPIPVRAGVADWTVLCPRAEWTPFLADLRKHVPSVEVLGVGVQSLRDPEGPLTRRQAEVYRQAVLEGYYELPRRISMSELAKRLHCSKSSLFELLSRAERKMLRPDLLLPNIPLVVPAARRGRARSDPVVETGV